MFCIYQLWLMGSSSIASGGDGRCPHRTRRAIRLLTGHELKNMGLIRQQAAFEMNKPFWKA